MSLLNELRFVLDEVCRWKPAKRVGSSLYWWAASTFAERWLRLPGVHSVALRGGMVRGCRPAISDLDFTILLDDCDSVTELKWARAVLRESAALKRAFPILGELTLTTLERWSHFTSFAPGPVLWYRDQLEFRDGTWAPLKTDGTPHASSRFALALDHFKIALSAAQMGRSRYDAIVREKELAKAGKYAGLGENAPVDALKVFRALDRLAQEALTTEFPSAEISWPEAPPLTKPVEALLGDWRIARWLKRPGFSEGAEPGEAPCSIVLTPAAANLWLPELFRREAEAYAVPLFPFSTAMAECRARGWSGWWSSESLAQFPAKGAPSVERRGHLLRSLCERLCHDSVSLAPARLCQTKQAERERWARRFEFETNALRQMFGFSHVNPSSPDPLEQSICLARSAYEVVQAARQKVFPWRSANPSVIVSQSANDFQLADEAHGPRTLPNQ